jgi:putative transposase
MRAACADLDAELVEFNGESTTCTYSSPTHTRDLDTRPATQRLYRLGGSARMHQAYVRTRMRGHLWSQSYLAVSCRGAPLSIITQ